MTTKPQRYPELLHLIGGHPALDLVNTLDGRFRSGRPTDHLIDYNNLLWFTEYSALLPNHVGNHIARTVKPRSAEYILRYTRNMREALAEMLYAALDRREPNDRAVASLTRFLRDSRSEPVVWMPTNRKASRTHWAWHRGMTNGAELPLSVLGGSILNLFHSAKLASLRACKNPECRKLFIPTNRNRMRKWCDMSRCGSEAKRKAFKAKQVDY